MNGQTKIDDLRAETRGERKKRRNRQALVAAAYAVMAKKGIDAATMAEIADLADVGAGTMYNYFDSKDELAVAVLELVMDRLAQRIEAVMKPRLQTIAEKTGVIGDIRGRGAMIAVEIVKPGTDEPDAALTGAIAKACHAQGVVVLTAGTYGNVLRFLPPLVIPDHLLDEALTVIEEQFLAQTGH